MLGARPSLRPVAWGLGEGIILRGRSHGRLTIASILVLTGLLVMQTVDQALAGVVLPSGAGTLTIGPQAMEGNLQIHPGDRIRAGYDFTMPGAHAAAQVTVDNASITMAVTCSNGTTPARVSFALPVQTYSDPAGSSNWYPSGDQSSVAVYQGSVIAPDLCAGGIMSDANGATFKATIFSTDTIDKVNFRFHYSDNTSGSWSATITSPLTPTAKTVLSATLTPSLGLTLAVDHSSAIPGDMLTYSGTVTNTGATLTLTGDFTASASGSSSATVKSYWDNVATSLDSTTWTALAGSAAAQAGYTATVTPPITSGMTLTSTPVAANGVTYPTSGDPLLGTTIASGLSALWHYTASVPLTPSQVNTLLDPTKVKAIRNSFHLEVSPTNPNITQPSIINVDFSGIFFATSPAPSGAATNVTVTVQPPTGAAVTINSGTVAGLASLAPGASVTYSTTYKVLVPASKGSSETDAAYQARLTGVEGSKLSASASASGSSTGGPVSATAPAVSTNEHLPIMSITKSGPTTPVAAGTSASYPLALKNTGGATASVFAITDTVPSGDTGTISGAPSTLDGGASSSGAQATYAVPATQTPGNLTDTATISWQDANRDSYGPVSSSFTSVIQNTLLGARLTLALAAGNAGLNTINASQGLQLTLLNSGGVPIPNQAVTVSVTGANPTTLTAVTDANGQATLSYSGKSSGVDQLQATATSGTTTVSSNTVSVTWISPIQPIVTTPAQGNFFGETSTPTMFVAKPGDTAAFQQSFPTINFNPPANTVPHNVSGVGPQTVPFTDVTTDAVGNFAGTIVAQGNGVQAGAGTLTSFDAAFTANFVVAQPGDVTFNITVDDGFLLGVGAGASRTSGSLVGVPASGLTPFNSYPIVGAYNQAGGSTPATYPVTIHFPSAGVYPYELDYFECCGAQMSLTMTVVSVNTGPYNLSTGYADTVRPAGTSSFPFPWNGAANTTFVGSGSPYDTGGLRFDNNTNQPITLNHVTVDIGTHHYDPWNLNLSVPANGTLILAGAAGAGAFDTSEANGLLKSGGGGGSAGFVATQWATGFATCCGGIGPVGVAFDNAGNLFAMNYASGFLYKFGPSGGVSGPATQVNANSIQGCPAGLAFSKDGKHLYLAMQCLGTVLEIDQATGVVLRTVASGISAPTGIATDPLSGDLFVSQPNGTPTIQRIQNPLSASPTVSVYSSPGSTDGIAFGPDGSLYGSVSGQQVVIIAGTNTTSPGTVLTRIQNGALNSTDGIALLPPPPGAVGTSIVVNTNNGVLVQIDNPQTANPTFHNIVTGGSRGDFATVGPDGCLYATQTSSVIKVTASDGSCPFIPSICLPNPAVPQVHVTINGFTFNYNDTGQALNSAGIDGECNGTNESQAWKQVGGQGGPINIPLPPAMTLALQAAPATGHIVGQSQALTVAAMDGAGHTVPNIAVQLSVSGANPQQLSATTDANGTATFAYSSANAGTDTISATAFISGLRSVSNAVVIQWTIPAPGGPIGGTSGPAPPSVVITSPADGTPVSAPTPVTATVTPPSSSSISSWSVSYQNVSGGSPIIIASGNGNPPATLATFDPTGLAPGTYAITVTVTTAAGGGAFPVTRVIVGGGGGTAAQAPPTISAPSPADGTIVTKPVPVTATITAPAGQSTASWSVSYAALGLAPVTIASGTGAAPAPLATFDPTLVPDGIYAITVRGTASGGGSQSITTTVVVSGTLKPGRFVSTYRDLSVPVNGLQMESRRTYDSTDKSIGDFGTGWKLSFSNLRTSTNRQLGAGGWTEYPSQCIFGLCFYSFKTSTPHYVTVTFPDQHQEIFDFTPQGGAGILYWQGSAAFTARGGMGTTSTLQVAGDTSLSYGFDGNLYGGSGSFYNATRFQLTTRDGRVFVLDTTSGLISESDANGNSLNLDSSGVHFMLGPVSNPTPGPSITITRDPSNSNRITEVAGPNDGVNGQNQHVLYNYNAAGQLASVTDPESHTVHYTYDGSTGLLTGSTDPGGQPIQTITYGPDGRVTSIANGSEPATTIATAAGAQQQTTLDPNGQLTTVVTYDALGDILEKDQSFAAQTLSTKMAYDSAGRMTDLYDPNGHHQHWTFDETNTNTAGELLSYTDASGHTWQFTNYDARGQVGTVLAPDGSTSGTYTYNASGLMISSQIPGESPTLYTYDRSGSTKSVTDPKGRSVSYAYNSVGFMTSEADSAGNAVSYSPDAAGNVVAVKDASGNTTTFAYNGSGQLTGETDGAGVAYSYTYDGRGHLASASDPAGATSYLYNDVGLVQQRTDSNGAVTAYTYDADGNLTLETRPGGDTTTYRYDPVKQLVGAENGSGEVNLTYDRSGNLASQTSCAPQAQGAACAANASTASEPTATLTYGYFPNGDEQSVSGPSGPTTYVYDGADRLSTVTDSAGHPVVYANTPRGFPSSITFPDGVLQSRGYDGSGLITSNISTLSGGTVAGDTYGLDPVSGRVNSVANQDGTANFGHQANGWLSSEAQPAAAGLPSQTFSYDGAGNLTSWGAAPANTVKYDSAGRLIQAGNATFGYDGEGDLLSKTNSTNATPTTYTWNADHQLIAISYPDGTKSQYQYDPLGRRITVNTKGQITRYVYDGYNVTAAYDGQNNETIVYMLTPTGGRFADPQSPASALEAVQGSSASYYITDGNGSTIATLDSSGSVTARYRYSAFGQPAGANGPENTYTYQGAQYDSTSGLYYMTDRYYDPGSGRFLSRDPVASQYMVPALGNWTRHTGLSAPSVPSSLQRYPFASNDPLDFSDPSGDIPIPLVGAKVAAAACALFIAFSPATPAADTPVVQDCQQLVSAASDLLTKRGALSQYYSQLAKNPNFARLLMAEEEAQAEDDFLTGAMGLQDEVIALEG